MKRRKFTAQFKARVVLELISGAKSMAQACRQYGIRDSLLCPWRREFLQRAHRVFEEGSGSGEQEARIAELERMVARLTLELEAAKKAFRLIDSPRAKKRPEPSPRWPQAS